jgi:hypothetical protein
MKFCLLSVYRIALCLLSVYRIVLICIKAFASPVACAFYSQNKRLLVALRLGILSFAFAIEVLFLFLLKSEYKPEPTKPREPMLEAA